MPLPVLAQPEPKASELVSLCQSLNSPVVSIAELPVGPAQAAIAVHADSNGESHVTIALRCRRTDEVVLFGAPSEPERPNGFSQHAALLWAEGLGFLFDDELCDAADASAFAGSEGGGGAEGDGDGQKGAPNGRAVDIWRAFVRAADSTQDRLETDSTDDVARPSASAMLSKFRWECSLAPELGTGTQGT